MNPLARLPLPAAFGLSLALLVLIMLVSLKDWGIIGVILVILAYGLGFATARGTPLPPHPTKSIQDHIQSLDPEIRREITKLTKEGRTFMATEVIKANTNLATAPAQNLVERIAHR